MRGEEFMENDCIHKIRPVRREKVDVNQLFEMINTVFEILKY